jgi:hypothetical protein
MPRSVLDKRDEAEEWRVERQGDGFGLKAKAPLVFSISSSASHFRFWP